MPWATVNEIYESVAARMAADTASVDAMGPHVLTLATEAEDSAKHAIRSAMVKRGYTVAQVEAWDALKSWHLRIAACHAFRAMSANKAVASYLDPTAGVCKAEKQLIEDGVTLLVDGLDPLAAVLPAAGDLTNSAGTLALLDDIRYRTFEDLERQPQNPPGSSQWW